MRGRRLTIQHYWNRLMTAAAFMVTAVLSVPMAAEAGEGRVASAPAKHIEAVAKQAAAVLSAESISISGGGSSGDGDKSAIARPWLAMATYCAGPERVGDQGPDSPVEPLLIRAGRSRAPPSI